MRIYYVYRHRKDTPPCIVEIHYTWWGARHSCKEYNDIMKINGYADRCKYFYKKAKRVRSA